MKVFLAIIAGITLIVAGCADDAEEVVPEESPGTAPASPSSTEAVDATAPATPSPTIAVTPMATPTATPAPGFTRLTNEKYGYSVDYPDFWTLDPATSIEAAADSDYVALYSKYPATKIELVVLDNPEKLGLDLWVEEFVATSPEQAKIQSSAPLTVDGNQGMTAVISVYDQIEIDTAYFPIGDRVLLINALEWLPAVQREDLLASLRFTHD